MPETARQPPLLTRTTIVFWLVCVTLLGVGAKNFEAGLSVDAPLYAAIARNIARTGDFFNLHGNVDQLRPFVYHPPVFFWLVAAVFKVLPAADWSARIVGNVFYFGFLLIFFLYLRRKNGERTAVWAVILLWTFARFSNYFSNVYLDPGLLFFGSAAIFLADLGVADRRPIRLFAAGLCLGTAVLFKGIAAAGFVPTLGLLILAELRRTRDARHFFRALAAGLAGAAIPLALFGFAVKRSGMPDYLARYWAFQFTHAMGSRWNLANLLSPGLWGELFVESNYLAPLILVAARPAVRKPNWVAWSLFATFIFLLGGVGLYGDQYFLLVLPWVSWLVAAAVFSRIPWPAAGIVKTSGAVAIAALLVLQYLPIKIHGCPPTRDELVAGELSRAGRIRTLVLDSTPNTVDITTLSRFAWYGDVEVQYPPRRDNRPPPVPPATEGTLYVHLYSDEARERQIVRGGWCIYRRIDGRTLWMKCANGEHLSASR